MKKRGILLFSLLAAVLILGGAASLQSQQRRLSQKLIRLHVVARSDSEEDQRIKLQVRDAVLEKAEAIMRGKEDRRQALAEELPQIQEAACQKLAALGQDTQVRVRLGKERFPTRAYETFSLPAGVYESLRVTIGEGEGHNWWCVVFPSICLSAAMDQTWRAAQTAGITEGEWKLLTEADQGYKLKFKSIELLQAIKDFFSDT